MLKKVENSILSTIYPSIRHKTIINIYPVINFPINKELVIVIKCDIAEERTSYLLKHHLKNLAKTEEELLEIALLNFNKLNLSLKVFDSNLVIPNNWARGDFGGPDIVLANLIDKNRLKFIKDTLGESFYIYLPNYERFTAFKKNLPKSKFTKIKKITSDEFKKGRHPLSIKLFVYLDGKIKVAQNI